MSYGTEDSYVSRTIVREPHDLSSGGSDDTTSRSVPSDEARQTGNKGISMGPDMQEQGRESRPWCAPASPDQVDKEEKRESTALALVKSLSILDRFLAPLVLLAMILGVIIGVYAKGVQSAFNGAKFAGTSVPLVVGMIVMMWPALTKVQYERLPELLKTRRLWEQIIVSLILNWLIGPFVMLACAWAALPDLPTYRTGIILVGLARCIAMVMIWNTLAGGDGDLCAILVIINAVLQIVLYSPLAVFFIKVISHDADLGLEYGKTAIAVLVFLGIPLGLGLLTRIILIPTIGRKRFTNTFLPFFSPLSLIGLLYTIIVIFAQQARHILHHLGPVFRTFVPLVLYFIVMFGGTFTFMWMWSRLPRSSRLLPKGSRRVGYKEASVQSFTAASNNFELSIAVAVAVFGPESDQALAATIGPLVEVPVLLSLTWVSIWLGKRLKWAPDDLDGSGSDGTNQLEIADSPNRGIGSIEMESKDPSIRQTAIGTTDTGIGMDKGGTVDLV
ncbi:sodium bile acid symporter family-domain-containing protein [Naematelia encephala]|uniref:Sodium bile acid symporter family-domain-containing protein n=1 Tax=Naematelia encephala TaxID=71784 RepID=A0A1Y2AVW1_9TREE|nr:sodium bile acid symporter family-domain-containing protein [Naematelia encephala]